MGVAVDVDGRSRPVPPTESGVEAPDLPPFLPNPPSISLFPVPPGANGIVALGFAKKSNPSPPSSDDAELPEDEDGDAARLRVFSLGCAGGTVVPLTSAFSTIGRVLARFVSLSSISPSSRSMTFLAREAPDAGGAPRSEGGVIVPEVTTSLGLPSAMRPATCSVGFLSLDR
jgi:hypothetical protein